MLVSFEPQRTSVIFQEGEDQAQLLKSVWLGRTWPWAVIDNDMSDTAHFEAPAHHEIAGLSNSSTEEVFQLLAFH